MHGWMAEHVCLDIEVELRHQSEETRMNARVLKLYWLPSLGMGADIAALTHAYLQETTDLFEERMRQKRICSGSLEGILVEALLKEVFEFLR